MNVAGCSIPTAAVPIERQALLKTLVRQNLGNLLLALRLDDESVPTLITSYR
jgi:hypothetical protein